jgi:hypothetical protein
MRSQYLYEPTAADRGKRRRGKSKYTLASNIVVEKPPEDSLLARFWRGCVDPRIRVTRNGHSRVSPAFSSSPKTPFLIN